MKQGTIYVEVAHPEHARWEALHESPARDGWWFAREVRSGQVLSFPPGALRPYDDAAELRAEAKRLSLDLSGVKSNHPKD